MDIMKKNDVSFKDILGIVQAVSQVYPMIVLANLTKNTYTLLRNEGLLYNKVMDSGCYDDLIDDNVKNIHKNYQKLFLECFSREYLIKTFKDGKTEVYAELYQKNEQGNYHWVSIQVVRIYNKDGDICHICLNRGLDGIVDEKHTNRR
ncbi:MAG: hypothetical protein ACI4D8_08425 [Wujia sp.]